MRPLVIGLLALLLTATVPRAQAPPTATPISGRVVDARNDAPLRRARVTITIAGRAGDPVFSGDDGRFVIREAPRGTFTITVAKGGYISAVLTPSAAQLTGPLTFGLTRSVAVEGRVVESSGAPPMSAYVTARLLSPAPSGGAGAKTRFFTETDLLGGYRLGGLAAGRYEITAVRIPPLQRINGVGPLEERLFDSPGSFDVARAVTVSVDPGDELRDLDFSVPGATERGCSPGPGVISLSQTTTARIRGRVLGSAGEPLVCAQVHVSSVVGSSDDVPYVQTDADGRYSVEGLPAGSFVVQAYMRPSHLSLRYGQRRPSDDERVVVLREGERRDSIDITLPREAMITGTVWDEHGEPVEGVPVWAFQLRRRNGRVVGASPAIARATDDRGQYRIVAVPPGSYLIGALATGDLTTTGTARGYVSGYYPSTNEIPLAAPVVVDAGAELRGIDIALNPVRTATVSGVVLDPAGQPFSGTVSMTTSARAGIASLSSRSAPTDASGRFVLQGVPPGDYVLKAPVQGASPLFGTQNVTVTEGDPAPVTLKLTDGATLEGRLVFDVASGTNPAGLELTYASIDFDRDPAVHRSSFVREFGAGGSWDGTFRMTGVFGPSRLTLARMPGCDTCYLKSALVNGTDAAETPFDFGLGGGRYRDVQVVVSDAGATIEGRLADEADTRAAVTMVVMPAWDARRHPASRYVKTAPKRDGRFEAAGLPPGEYIVAATSQSDAAMSTLEPDNPEFGALLEARGTRVTVFERERASVSLRLLRR
jgi:hypothetical protein